VIRQRFNEDTAWYSVFHGQDGLAGVPIQRWPGAGIGRAHEPVIITKYERPVAVLIGIDEWEEFEEFRDREDSAAIADLVPRASLCRWPTRWSLSASILTRSKHVVPKIAVSGVIMKSC
jgi:antitoxin (DNA-binding transcriptional repressor) of toxin-antitoxin stability system